MQGGQVLTGADDHYIVKYNQRPSAIRRLPTSARTLERSNRLGWSLLESVEEEEEFPSDLIEMVQLAEKLPTKGRVAFDSEELAEIGLKKGDIVGFKENRDYRIKIDGTEYYRTRVEDLLYVEVEETLVL